MRSVSSMSEKKMLLREWKQFSARAFWSSLHALFQAQVRLGLSFPKTNFSARAVFREQLCDLIPQVAGIISLLLPFLFI